MPKISAEKLQDRYDSILDAARQTFAEKGFEASSIAQIAQVADVSEGLIYRYFDNKRDLLSRVIEIFYSAFVAEIQTVVTADEDFETRLNKLIRAHLRSYVDHPEIGRLYIAESRTTNYNLHPNLQVLDKRYGSLWMRFVQNGIRDGSIRQNVDPRIARDLLWGVLENVARRHLSGRVPINVDATCRDIVDVMLEGLRNQPTGSRRTGRRK